MADYKTSLDRQISQREKELTNMKSKREQYTEKLDKLERTKCKCGSSRFAVKVSPDLHKYSIWSGRTVYLVCLDCWEVYEIHEGEATH